MAINSKLTLSNERYLQALEEAGGALARFVGQSSIQMQALYRESDYLNRGLSGGIGRFSNDMKSFGQSMSMYVTLPILAMSGAMISAYAKIDSLRRGLDAVTGSTQGTGERMKELMEVAKLPGLGFEEAVQGDVRLRAIGFSAKMSKDALLQFGNAIASTGGGKLELGTVITQLGQMASKGKVLAEDLKPIINASPLVAKAIKDMFGTVDSETISGKLKTVGKDSKQFIEELITKLTELPRVTGGIGNALETFGDSAKIAMSGFGESLDKTLGITDKLNAVGDTILKWSEGFKELDPNLQKVIIGVVGFVAVAPPLLAILGTIGGLVASGGAIATGFSLLTGPIGLAAVAIAGFVTLVVTNWDSIKQTLRETGIWDAVTEYVSVFASTISAVFTGIKTVVVTTWDAIKSTVMPIVESIGTGIAIAFRSIVGVATGVMKILKGIFTLSFSDIWGGVKDVIANVFIGIFGIVSKGVAIVASLFGGLVKSISFGKFGDSILQWSDTIAKENWTLNKVSSPAKSIASVMSQGTGSTTNNDYTNVNTGGGKGKKSALPAQSEEFKAYFKELQDRDKVLDEIYKKIQVMIPKGVELGKVGSRLINGDDAFGKVGAVDNRKNPITGLVDSLDKAIPALQDKLKEAAGTIGSGVNSLYEKTVSAFRKFDSSITAPMIDVFMNLNESLNGILRQGAADVLSGIGNMAGKMIVGASSFKDAGSAILGVIGSIFSQMGEQYIKAGVILAGLALFAANPITGWAAMIGVGLALTALGGAISGAMSSGGGSGASSYSSASSYSPSASSSGNMSMQRAIQVEVTGTTSIKGNDLYISYQNASRAYTTKR